MSLEEMLDPCCFRCMLSRLSSGQHPRLLQGALGHDASPAPWLRSLPTQPVVGLQSHEAKGYKTQGAGALLTLPGVSTAPARVLPKLWPMLSGVSQGLDPLFWVSFGKVLSHCFWLDNYQNNLLYLFGTREFSNTSTMRNSFYCVGLL